MVIMVQASLLCEDSAQERSEVEDVGQKGSQGTQAVVQG